MGDTGLQGSDNNGPHMVLDGGGSDNVKEIIGDLDMEERDLTMG